jgi:hypothetical protein
LQAGASSLGAASIPAVVGLLLGHLGARALGPCLLVITVAAAAMFLVSTASGYAVPE